MVIKELILIRHAESEWQAGLTNNPNSELSERGHLQVSLFSKWFRENFDLNRYTIYCSEMTRAKQTCQFILENQIRLNYSRNLGEAGFHVRGSLELSKSFINSSEAKHLVDYYDYERQVAQAINEMSVHNDNDRVLAFTHAGFIKTAVRLFTGSNKFCVDVENCSISQFECIESGWIIKKLNHVVI